MNTPEKIAKLIELLKPDDPGLFKHEFLEWSQKEVSSIDDCVDHLFNLALHGLPMPWTPDYNKTVHEYLLERSKMSETEFKRLYENPWGSFMKVKYQDGQPCRHPGCMAHISHPCERCGRVGARGVVYEGLSIS